MSNHLEIPVVVIPERAYDHENHDSQIDDAANGYEEEEDITAASALKWQHINSVAKSWRYSLVTHVIKIPGKLLPQIAPNPVPQPVP